MEQINYQKETERIIESLCTDGLRPRLLLHVCCAPCASYVLEYLCRHVTVTAFFCNPNLTDRTEYEKRLGELYRFTEQAPFCSDVTVAEDNISPDAFFTASRGLESAPEGGARCERCFRLRLSRTAKYAKEHGFDRFATTLTVSPHKNADLINKIGRECAEEFGIEYLPSDFKKKNGYRRSIELSREYGLYRQNYCGCVFSEAEARKRENERRISEQKSIQNEGEITWNR